MPRFSSTLQSTCAHSAKSSPAHLSCGLVAQDRQLGISPVGQKLTFNHYHFEVSNDVLFNIQENIRSGPSILFFAWSRGFSRPTIASSSLELRRQGGSEALGFDRSCVLRL